MPLLPSGSGGTSQVACSRRRTSALGGRAVPRLQTPPGHLPPLTKRRFFMVTIKLPGALALAKRTLSSAAAAALLLAAAALHFAASAAARPDGGYPLTVTASNGPVLLAAKPVRIVSLSPTAT